MTNDESYLIDQGDMRKYRIEIPNLVDDMDISVHAFRLYAHIKRVTGSNGGSCWQSTATLAKACNMSAGTISKIKVELENSGLIAIEKGDRIRTDVIRIIDIWPQNFEAFRGCSPDERSVHQMNAGVHQMNVRKNPLRKNPLRREGENGCSSGEHPPSPPLLLDDIPVTPPQQPSSQSSSKTNRTGTHQHIDPRKIAADGIIADGKGDSALEVYKEVFNYPPTKTQIKAMSQIATDLAKWRGILIEWNLRGYRSNNFAGILDVYKNGWRANGNNNNNNSSQSTETDPDVEMWFAQSSPTYTAEELKPMTQEEINALPF